VRGYDCAGVSERDRASRTANLRQQLECLIEIRRAELGALERALSVIMRDGDDDARCECNSDESPCDGELYRRFCRTCALIFARCSAHGGSRATASLLNAHREKVHASRSPATGEPPNY